MSIDTMSNNNLQKAAEALKPQMSRTSYYAQKVVFVDGQDGCGKTMFSPIVASFDRVELLTYAYEIEYICSLHQLQKLKMDAAMTLVRMLTDLQLYNTMMARETNFRPSDLSSVFLDSKPGRYFKRLFLKGDEYVPDRIKAERPILNICIHNILGYSEPILRALGDRAVLIEVVRHPLYMIKQQILNMETISEDARDFRLNIKHGNREVPYWAYGWEDLFLTSPNPDKAIYCMRHLTNFTEDFKKKFGNEFGPQILTIPFECFVLDPWPYMEQIKNALGSEITTTTRRMLKKQNIPRKMYAEGIGLPIYKRCGWVPPKKGSTENDEFSLRRQHAAKEASVEAMKVLDELSTQYEETYLGGVKDYPRPYKH